MCASATIYVLNYNLYPKSNTVAAQLFIRILDDFRANIDPSKDMLVFYDNIF